MPQPIRVLDGQGSVQQEVVTQPLHRRLVDTGVRPHDPYVSYGCTVYNEARQGV
jgi:hypothetical protein